MTLEDLLLKRSHGKCELCARDTILSIYDVTPNSGPSADSSVLICEKCLLGINSTEPLDDKHWYCLSESMWSEFPVVQVLAYRVLKKFGDNPWAHDLVGQLYLDEELQAWADAGVMDDSGVSPTLDSNGTVLAAGDTVTLIKDLPVKGANFTAKRGTTVKNISLTDDPKLIEGRVNGSQIVLVAAYLKKA